jgi:hypothetical protein
MAVICVDFDDTLMDTTHIPAGKRLGPPTPGAVSFMNQLHAQGDTIIIFTVRGGEPRGKQAVEDWLDYFKIPFSAVTNIKVNAEAYIDNRAIRYQGSWSEVKTQLIRSTK